MLPTLVIGLREGLEASLIVGIVAAFLRRTGRRDAIRAMWIGVGIAVCLCVAAGVTLDVIAHDLPQRQQEGLETVIGVAAVAMVTYMIVWMKNHARGLKGSLEAAAGSALAQGSALALTAMAFLAVLREGLETVVFLLAAFNASGSAGPAALGAVLGIVLAIAAGYGIYRGGVRINLSRFFRATGVVLALVAAGLVVSALHTAHEAGWLNVGQQTFLNLAWLAEPGSVRASLLTGVLGVQPTPTLIEVVGWLVYVIPVLIVVLWPPSVPVPRRGFGRALLVGGGLAFVAAVAIEVASPAEPASAVGQVQTIGVHQTSTPGREAALVGASTAQQDADVSDIVQVRSATSKRLVVSWTSGSPSSEVTLEATGSGQIGGINARVYTASSVVDAPQGSTQSDSEYATFLTLGQLMKAAHGRLPLGINPQTAHGAMPLVYTSAVAYEIMLDPQSMRVIDAHRTDRTVASLTLPAGSSASLGVVTIEQSSATQHSIAAALETAHRDAQTTNRHEWMSVRWPLFLLTLGLVLAAAGVSLLLGTHRNRKAAAIAVAPQNPSTAIHHQGETV